ncbi:hypothetical protein [Streptomyces sp. ALB3]|uniref:hypothetical protein n=1 Tax=Streptomyces sp. ALB3 TaxID=3374278 RepID=UPI0037A1DFDA
MAQRLDLATATDRLTVDPVITDCAVAVGDGFPARRPLIVDRRPGLRDGRLSR